MKYSAALNQKFENAVLETVASSDKALTINEIIQANPILTGLTTQKIARILNYFCDMGFCRKAKSNSKKRMVYRSVASIEAEAERLDSLNKSFREN